MQICLCCDKSIRLAGIDATNESWASELLRTSFLWTLNNDLEPAEPNLGGGMGVAPGAGNL